MIVRFARPGKSFAGLASYLGHDAGKARTSDRVGWTRTLNLANDHVASAIDEMLACCSAAEALKREAGIAPGGRKLEHPVRHISLNWHPSDRPTREDMVEAVQDFLLYMGWDDRQAVLFSHTDKPYEHVHIMLNVVSPVDGRSLDASFERVRASHWALLYERSQFRIHCEQRLRPYEQREPSPARDVWQSFRDAEDHHDRSEFERLTRAPDYFERGDRDGRNSKEWALLKAHQHAWREAFFIEGKQAFRELRNGVFREVRTEFRGEWAEYFEAVRRGLDAESLASMKADITARQKAEVAERRDEGCKELRERRDLEYRQLLRQQKEERARLSARQTEGLSSPYLLDLASTGAGPAGSEKSGKARTVSADRARFPKAAREICSPRGQRAEKIRPETPEIVREPVTERFRVHDGASLMGGVGLGILGALGELAERLVDGFFGASPEPAKPERPAPEPVDDGGANEQRRRQANDQDRARDEEAAEATRLHAYWQERRQRNRSRD